MLTSSKNKIVNVIVENAQCVKKATIQFEENAINVKFGYNGLGKSSIGKAIDTYINQGKLKDLSPYSGGTPKVTMDVDYKSCKTFSADYINNVLFKKEALDACFPVFVNDDAYKLALEEVKSHIENISSSVNVECIADFNKKYDEIATFNSAFTNGGALKGSSKISKGLVDGANPVKALDPNVSNGVYKDLIESDFSRKWAQWVSACEDRFIINNKCPLCGSELPDDFEEFKEALLSITNETSFVDNIEATSLLSKLANLAPEDLNETINKIVEKNDKLDDTDIANIKAAFELIAHEHAKIYALLNLSYTLSILEGKRTSDELKTELEGYKLDQAYFANLSGELGVVANEINSKIDELLSNIDALNESVDKMNSIIAQSVEKSQKQINTFLTYAGIPYRFALVNANGELKVEIQPADGGNLKYLKQHLSYGEANCLSLALFGAMVSKEETDLVIVDDPISSFDENKKFAVMYFLFNRTDGVLNGRTVLMLTHDMEPVLDFVYKNTVKCQYKTGCLLSKDINGEITEEEILHDDIKTAVQYEYDKAKDKNVEMLLRVVHLRRYYEIMGYGCSLEYQLLSSALKYFAKPTYKINSKNYRDFTSEELNSALKEVHSDIEEFDYDSFVNYYKINKLIDLYRNAEMKDYERFVVARGIVHRYSIEYKNKFDERVDKTIMSFLDETYHIENIDAFALKGDKQVPPQIKKIIDVLIDGIEADI